ncbi:MAG TPA: M24 family metallopeptidase [Stellaceae bacterium]|jgi:Xaa-Pro aminopeptidase|nr:M24 family metallopeptidase [Stellaceae bacterium]
MNSAALAIPRLSLAERDRRYRLVRVAMAAENLDVLICPAATSRWEQNMADSRYLTTIGGFGTEALTIFPRDGEVTAYVFNRAAFWRAAQDWVADVRDGRNLWLKNIEERLGELKLVSGRIGIAGLSGLTRTPDGIIPHATVEGLKQAFPRAELVNATALMSRAREVKSAEEITLMRRATAIAEAMVGTLAELKPGDTERTIFANMTHRLVTLGGDLPAMLIIGSGPDLAHGMFVPTLRVLAAGDVITGEVEGRYAGYSGQIVRPAILGIPRPDFRELVAITAAVFDDILPAMKAGATLGSVLGAYEAAVARRGGGSCKTAYPLMHARGLGDEYPTVLSPDDIAQHGDFKLEAGMAFVLKPRVAKQGVPTAQIGDMVVVGATGGERLGREALGLKELPWPA